MLNCSGRAVTNVGRTCGPTPLHTFTCDVAIKYVYIIAKSKCTECIIFIVVMHITFQGLDGEYFYSILMEFRLYIWKKITISLKVVYSCFQSNIVVRKLTLLHFAHFYVLLCM